MHILSLVIDKQKGKERRYQSFRDRSPRKCGSGPGSHRVASHRGGNELRESVYNTCISADVICCALAK